MNLRRVLGTLVASALFAGLVQPLPVLAATPTLNVITLDPLAANSSSRTGTAPFDANSYDGTNYAGEDASGTDHVVRTNDLISYDFQFNVNSANASAVTLTSTLGQSGGVDVADWTSIPSGCGPGSNISGDGQTLTCVVGAVTQGSAQDIVGTAKVRVSAPNGSTISPSVTISDAADGATPVTTPGYWTNETTPSATNADTITSTTKYNLLKTGTLAKPIVESYTYNGEGGQQGYYIDFPILVREGDGTASGAFGISSAPASITFTDTLNPGLNAVLPASNDCGVNGSGATIQNEPYGKIGVTGSATSANSVIDSGTITCTQGAPGGPISITINNAVSTGATFPVNHAGGAGVDNLTYIVADYLRLFVPDTGGSTIPGTISSPTAFGDTYTPINPTQPNPNEPPGNLTGTVNVYGHGPAPASGSSGKAFYQTESENGFPYNNASGPALTPGNSFVSVFAINNTSNASTGSVSIDGLTACDTIDTAHATVTPLTAALGGADANWGGAVRLSGINGGSFTDATAPTGFTVLYGDTSATCSGSTHYYASATDPTFTALNPISIVKVTMTQALAPGQQLRVQIGLNVISTLAAGTIVQNHLSATGTASTGGTGFTTSAYTQGQVFTTNLSVTKYLYKTTTSTSLFNASGAAAYGTAHLSGGQVDTNQEFVAYLDQDGSQGTLPSNNVVTCDLVPANAAIADFDGTTGPAVATYGGPVTFATLSGTAPASYLVEYSTAPQVVGDTCLNPADGWTSTPPTPRSSITKVRATYTLPAVTRVRMLVNFQANSGLAVGTIISNSMVTTVGGLNPLTSAQNVTVEPETVSVTKTGPGSAINAGSPAGFTLQGYIQGVGAVSSGVVTVADTLPAGLTYVPNSAVLTPPPSPTTWVAGSGSATPTITTNGSGLQVLTWTLGTATANPGVYIQLPTITFQANTDISIANGTTLTNNVLIADPNDPNPNGPGHTAQASVVISNSGAFHISKTTSTTQIATGGTIVWSLNYANTGASDAASTDFIDVLPYTGDSRGSSYHGTVTLATYTGNNGETFEFTSTAPAQLNDDPGCSSNGGSVADGSGGCNVVTPSVTTWCPALSGGACPSTLAQVTAVRIIGGVLPHNSGTRTVTLTASTAGNSYNGDQYWNAFGARTNILTLGVHSAAVETIVSIGTPIVALVKTCIAPPTCTTAAQAPGTDITYGITGTNTGGRPAAQLVITDPIPANMDFKIGTATYTVPGGTTMTVSYSADGSTYTYTPVSGGGGAAAGYDRNVVDVRWTLTTGQLTTTAPGNVATVQFTAAIR